MTCDVETPKHFSAGVLQLGHELHYAVLEIRRQTLQKEVKLCKTSPAWAEAASRTSWESFAEGRNP